LEDTNRESRQVFYQSKDHLREVLKLRFGDFDENEPYVVKAPEQGYCLVYKPFQNWVGSR
jgi:hypothetical protein